jgi:TolA-binding protein
MSQSVRRLNRLGQGTWPVVLLAVLAAALPVRADEADDRCALAAGHYAQQRWTLAAEAFETFLVQHPDHAKAVDARFYLGETLLQLGRFDDAAARFHDSAQRDPNGPHLRESLFRAGEMAYLAGKLDRAKTELEAFLEKYPEDGLAAYALPYLGDIALTQKDTARAEKCFREGLERFPEGKLQDNCRFGLARVLEKQGKSDEAEKLYLALAGKTTSKLAEDAQFRLGAVQYSSGKYREAIESFSAFETRLGSSRHRALAKLGLGWALMKSDRPAEAGEKFRDIAGDPKVGIEARYWLGLAQKAQQDWRQAATTLLDAAAADPKHRLLAALRFHAGDALLRQGDLPAARGQFDLAIAAADKGEWLDDALRGSMQVALRAKDHAALDRQASAFADRCPRSPLRADVQRMLAQSLVERKEYRRAAELLEPLVQADETARTVSTAKAGLEEKCLLALAYARTGRLPEAKRLYSRLARYGEDPLVAVLAEPLADAALDAGDTAWSAELYKRATSEGKTAKPSANALSGLGWSQYRSGNREAAAATFGKLLELKPDAALAAETALVRGRVFEEMELPDPALAMYDLILSEYPKTKSLPQAIFAAARLRHKLHQDSLAAQLFERFVKEFPNQPELDAALYQWAWSLFDLGKAAESTETFLRLHRQFPQSPYWADATFRLAQRAYDAKDLPRTKQFTTALLAAKTESGIRENAQFLAGQAAAAQEQWPEAQQAFEAVAEQGKSQALVQMARYAAAEAMARQGRHDAASQALKTLAAATDSQDAKLAPLVKLRLAQSLCHERKWSEAYQVAAKIEKDHAGFEEQYEVDYVLGRCLASRAEFDAAREAYRRAIRSPGGAKTQTAAAAQLMLAETYFHQKDYETALREYLAVEILYAFPAEQAASLVQAGKCQEILGRDDEAVKSYARVSKQYAETPYAKEAAEREKLVRQRAAGEQGPAR